MYISHIVLHLQQVKHFFEIGRNDGVYKQKSASLIAGFFAAIACLCSLIVLYLLLQKVITSKPKHIIAFFIGFLMLRTGMIYLKIPNSFYDYGLYDATVFANATSFYFQYMGDILINCFFIFYVPFLSIN